MLRAKALAATGKTDRALGLLHQVAAECPDDVRPHQALAALYLDADELVSAARHLREVVRLQPSDLAAARVLARVTGQTDPPAAARLMAETPDPTDLVARLRAARVHCQAEHHAAAEQLYADLLAEVGDDATLYLEAGELADTMGACDLAIKRLITAAKVAPPEDGRPLQALAVAYAHAGQLAAAGRCWWRLRHHDELAPEARAGLLACALATNRIRLARRLQRELPSPARGEQTRQLLARAWQHVGLGLALRPADDDRPDAASARPSPLTHMLRASADALARHADRHPARSDTYYHLAVCQCELGQTGEAADSVTAAVAINPRYARAAELAASLGAAPLRDAG
jgi:Flp pilus assembly protein TadD